MPRDLAERAEPDKEDPFDLQPVGQQISTSFVTRVSVLEFGFECLFCWFSFLAKSDGSFVTFGSLFKVIQILFLHPPSFGRHLLLVQIGGNVRRQTLVCLTIWTIGFHCLRCCDPADSREEEWILLVLLNLPWTLRKCLMSLLPCLRSKMLGLLPRNPSSWMSRNRP